MKICTVCGEEKEESEFNYKNKSNGTLNLACKLCSRLQTRNHYYNNKEYYYDRNARSKKDRLAFVRNYKKEMKCSQCGEQDPACLDLHHTDPAQKEFTIGTALVKGLSIARLEVEMLKCIVLCSNCHRKLHFYERSCDAKETH